MSNVNTFFFSGDSEARSRNGYFDLREAQVWRQIGGRIVIDFYSKCHVEIAPIQLQLNLADLQILHAVLEVAVRELREEHPDVRQPA